MGRPRCERYVKKRIDQKLDNFIISYSKRNKIGNYRKASEELAKWLKDLEKKHKL